MGLFGYEFFFKKKSEIAFRCLHLFFCQVLRQHRPPYERIPVWSHGSLVRELRRAQFNKTRLTKQKSKYLLSYSLEPFSWSRNSGYHRQLWRHQQHCSSYPMDPRDGFIRQPTVLFGFLFCGALAEGFIVTIKNCGDEKLTGHDTIKNAVHDFCH